MQALKKNPTSLKSINTTSQGYKVEFCFCKDSFLSGLGVRGSKYSASPQNWHALLNWLSSGDPRSKNKIQSAMWILFRRQILASVWFCGQLLKGKWSDCIDPFVLPICIVNSFLFLPASVPTPLCFSSPWSVYYRWPLLTLSQTETPLVPHWPLTQLELDGKRPLSLQTAASREASVCLTPLGLRFNILLNMSTCDLCLLTCLSWLEIPCCVRKPNFTQ